MRAQAPQGPQSGAERPSRASLSTFPVPTNLRVLPKNLSGQQVHDIMEQWAHSLGVRCDSCHSEDIDAVNPDGRPRLNFADDSKPMKAVARIMYTMTDKINAEYVAKVDGSGLPVTCGTCHRGEISPEPFTMQPPAQPPVAQTPPIGDEGPHSK
ncbi:MAG: c-type cytochrome [Terracidiphilus sp.]